MQHISLPQWLGQFLGGALRLHALEMEADTRLLLCRPVCAVAGGLRGSLRTAEQPAYGAATGRTAGEPCPATLPTCAPRRTRAPHRPPRLRLTWLQAAGAAQRRGMRNAQAQRSCPRRSTRPPCCPCRCQVRSRMRMCPSQARLKWICLRLPTEASAHAAGSQLPWPGPFLM